MILRTKNNPCYRCKDRELYCHDNCYRYATYKQKMERASKAAREHKEINNYIHTVVCATRNAKGDLILKWDKNKRYIYRGMFSYEI